MKKLTKLLTAKTLLTFGAIATLALAGYSMHADAKSGWIYAPANQQLSYKITDAIDEYEHQGMIHQVGYIETQQPKNDIVKF